MIARTRPAVAVAPFLLFLISLAAGCAGLSRPIDENGGERGRPDEFRAEVAFSHASWDRFLARHVDSLGRIDYGAAANDRADLDAYLSAISSVSPDSSPRRFHTDADRLAYWINAYNAATVGLVLKHYPIRSVQDVQAPWLLRFLPEGAGFFVFETFRLGGQETSLYALENSLIRRRFLDPRIHFALNCASASCPRLPAEAFASERLEEQLARETTRFFAEERNYALTVGSRRVQASAIFDWYEKDFTQWVVREAPEAAPSLLAYFERHLPESKKEALARCESCRVEFRRYDWSLNDRASAPEDAELIHSTTEGHGVTGRTHVLGTSR